MDSHFNGYKARYEILNHYMLPICQSQIVTSMNIFINLDDLFHTLHNPLINNEFQIAGKDAPKQLLSNIFNLIGHYRYWALKNQYDVKVFAVYTSTIRSFKNAIYTPEYRKHFKMINSEEYSSCFFVNHAIQNILKWLHIIAKYIPGIYIIDSKYLEPSMLPLYISDEISHMHWNMLVSRDTYDLQYSYRDKWSLLTPKGEHSQVVNQHGIWNYVNFKERVFKDEIDLRYPYSLYILAKAVVGDKYRNIPRLRRIGWKTLFKYLDAVMEENPDASDTTLKIKLIEKIKGKSELSNSVINSNLNSINVDLQKDAMLEIDKALIEEQVMDIPDYNNLQELNRTEFRQYPLNLQFLCDVNKNNKIKTPFD